MTTTTASRDTPTTARAVTAAIRAGGMIMCRNAASIALVLAVLAAYRRPPRPQRSPTYRARRYNIAAGTADGLPAGLRLEVEGPSSTTCSSRSRPRPTERLPRRRRAGFGCAGRRRSAVGGVGRHGAGPAQAQPEAATHQPSGLRGRVGIRYLATRDGLNERAEFQQPALDLRLDAPSMYGTPWGSRSTCVPAAPCAPRVRTRTATACMPCTGVGIVRPGLAGRPWPAVRTRARQCQRVRWRAAAWTE